MSDQFTMFGPPISTDTGSAISSQELGIWSYALRLAGWPDDREVWTGKHESGTAISLERMAEHAPDLSKQAQLASITTPSASDGLRSGTMTESMSGSSLTQQARLADFGATATGGMAKTVNIGQLNAGYSRWLMGLPPVWCDCAATAMQSLPRSRKPSSRAA